MNYLYNIAVLVTGFLIKIAALFNKKIKLFVNGRKETFQKLKSNISINDKIIWFHCASLGEFEQGRPIMEKIKSQFQDYKLVLTFFSPSGYEVRHDYGFADVVTYLPLDTRSNAKKFLDIVHPEMVVFVKYEFWPNILLELKLRKIETILVSGIFREDQAFFKNYGFWMRNSLQAFSYFFVQNENSKKLLQQINFKNITISGDTRFDRVFEILDQDNNLGFIEDFIENKYVLVAGSTWPEDEEFLINYINYHAGANEKFIIAPHNIDQKGIANLKKSISKRTILYSEKKIDNDASVFIIDTVGLLTKIYSYAKVAYIGGGFGKEGVHNVLEPATYGIPLIIGPVFQKFKEAVDLVNLKACEVVNNNDEFNKLLIKFYQDEPYRNKKGKISKDYILNNTGATKIILNYITTKL
jgi:3-deoxy-D-manno-octulosonic-acid transferase